MRSDKRFFVSIMISALLFILAISFSGCFFAGDDDAAPALTTDTTTRLISPTAYSPGAWVAQTAVEKLFGVAADKLTDKFATILFGDEAAEKMDQLLAEVSAINGKLDNIDSHISAIGTQINSLRANINKKILDLETILTDNMSIPAVAGIQFNWEMFTRKMHAIAAGSTGETLITDLRSALNKLANAVDPPSGLQIMPERVNQLSMFLLDGNGGGQLLKLWTDQAITGYMSNTKRTEADLINAYNYVESQFQRVLLHQAKGAAMIVLAYQTHEGGVAGDSSDSVLYRQMYKEMMQKQAQEFRKQVERLVLTCVDIKTSKTGNFLPAGYKAVFERADYIYMMLAGPFNTNGSPVYGICGRVISPVDLAAGGTSINAGNYGTLIPAETAIYDSETVSGSEIVKQPIDVWKTEYVDNISQPISKFTLSNSWYVYRYYKGSLGASDQGVVGLELNNDIKKTVPVCYDCPVIASYDESTFSAWASIANAEARIIKYGDFVITAGFAGNSVFFALPKDAPILKNGNQPYVWYSYCWADSSNSYSNVDSLYAASDNNSPRLGSQCSSVSDRGMVDSRCYLIASLQKTLKFEGNSNQKALLHFDLEASGYNSFNHGGDGQYNNFVGIKLLESTTANFSSNVECKKEEGYTLNRSSNESHPAIDAGDEGPQINISGTFSGSNAKEFSVTFEPGKYYRIELYANIYGKARGYITGYGSRTNRYGTRYSLASYAKLNELYLKLQ